MIKNNELLSMSEVGEYLKETDASGTDVAKFIKKFTKLTPKNAKELRKKIEELDLMKVRAEHIVKIIDLMPENQEDLNKIFGGISLDENETKKILETIKELK